MPLVGLHYHSKEGVKGRGAAGSEGGAGGRRAGAEAEEQPDTVCTRGRGHPW